MVCHVPAGIHSRDACNCKGSGRGCSRSGVDYLLPSQRAYVYNPVNARVAALMTIKLLPFLLDGDDGPLSCSDLLPLLHPLRFLSPSSDDDWTLHFLGAIAAMG